MQIILRVVNDINEKLRANAVAMQIPVGQSEDFNGIIDVLTDKMATFEGDNGYDSYWQDVPAEYNEQVEELRIKLLKLHVILMKLSRKIFKWRRNYYSKKLKLLCVKVLLLIKLTPAFCGTAFKNKGVQLVLDACC